MMVLRWKTASGGNIAQVPSSTYPVTYAYNLAGGLKTLTDPFGAAINYAFNDAGQLTAITGSVFAGVSQYASSMQYRAWGARKHMVSGDGGNVDVGYNRRLQITSFAPNFGATNYQYYADGRVSFVQYVDNSTFDRKYSYDHAGRLSEGLSGTDARSEQYNPDNPNPYKQTYTYDVWANMTARSNRWWTLDQGTFTASYTNDRNLGWQYDSAGNVKNNLHGQYTYDTAGRMKEFDRVNEVDITQLYDGDGFPCYRSESRVGLTDRAIIYYVRSRVLGGQPITELKPNGGKRRTYVYANGQEIARQEKIPNAPDRVDWINRDPVTGDDDINRDPLGAYLGNEFSVLEPDYAALKGNSPTHDSDADPFDSGSGCTLDGVPFDCNSAIGLVNQGAAFYAPLKTIAPIYNRDLRRYTGFAVFDPFLGEFT
jgi:YD repeat-containing protein